MHEDDLDRILTESVMDNSALGKSDLRDTQSRFSYKSYKSISNISKKPEITVDAP